MNKLSNLYLLGLLSLPITVQATDLVNLLPSLYGGDGIQLIGSEIPEFSHAPHFEDDTLVKLGNLTTAAAEIELPLPNSEGGLLYKYDPLLSQFVTVSNNLGSIYAEKAQTIGGSNFTIGLSYSFVSFSTLQGDDLNSYSIALEHEDLAEEGADICIGGTVPDCYLFEKDLILVDLDIELNTQALFLYSTYGVTDYFDIGILIPVIHHDLETSTIARVELDESHEHYDGDPVHVFDDSGIESDTPNDHASGSKTGIGDIRLRAKYHIWSGQSTHIGSSFEIRLPTGDEDNLMGYGTYGAKPSMIVTKAFTIGEKTLNCHFNLGYEINAGSADQDEVDYVFSTAYGIRGGNRPITTVLDISGSYETKNKDGVGDKIVDASLGLKWKQRKNNLAYTNLRVPLNDDGLRADVIYTIGYEHTL